VGSLKPTDENYFAPKIQASECTQSMCNFNGECIFDSFTKQYFCKCAENWIGRNCSFKNQTQLELLQNLTVASAKTYTQSAGGEHDLTFLQVTTRSVDLMSDDLFDILKPLVAGQVMSMTKDTKLKKAQNYLHIISNMLEYTQSKVLNIMMSANATSPTHGRKLTADE